MNNKLKKYNQKRDFSKTNEPKGKRVEQSSKKRRFVVQHHMARKEHYDFRLELGGTLKSWAVPKGPSYNIKDKRLAVQVEDHPIDYRNFEGTILAGQYGGGTVMVWDEGYWEPLSSHPKKDLEKGSIKFELFGTRLKGKWTLVRFKEDNWLLIKENDSVNMFSDINKLTTSIKTGRTMKEIEEGKSTIKKVKNSKKNYIVEGITISNPDKIIFDKPKITKYDIALYYQKVSKRMLPYIENRIISTIRCPEGINGPCFFKKHFETDNPGIGEIKLPSGKGKKEDYYYIKTSEGLISEVQMNSYEFHIWGSKVSNINQPDMMVFDFDPDDKLSLDKVREGVKDLKSILDELNLKSYLKTSGGKGYHVVVPTTKLKNWNKFSDFAEDIAKVMSQKWPDKYTNNVRKENRKGKIFIDWIRNTKSATSVAPYSIRARKGAKVSMPIKWSELDKVKPDEITKEEAIKRLKRKDPWEDFYK